MSGKDITKLVRVQSICAGNGIVLENKLKEQNKSTNNSKKTELKDSFLAEFIRVHYGMEPEFLEKTAK